MKSSFTSSTISNIFQPKMTNIWLAPGQLLAGRYEIKEQLGKGRMALVFRAYDRARSEDIAVKVLLPAGLLSNETVKERFIFEATVSSQLFHPNIVNVFDVHNDDEHLFVTMELLKGQNLRQTIDARKMARQKFTEKEVIIITDIIADALKYAHTKTIHGDIKPENIWINEKGGYKVLGFGNARLMKTSQMTHPSAATGTAYYMAPEQLRGSIDIDGRVDQYALGVLMYELLTGEIPAGRIQSVRHKNMSRNTSNIINKMLEPIAEDRYDSMEEVREFLSNKEPGISLPPINFKYPGIAAAIIIILLTGGGIMMSGGGLSELWANIRVDFTGEEQRQYSEAIKLEGEIKVLERGLARAKKELLAKIEEGSSNIQKLEDRIRSSKNEADKNDLKNQLRQMRFDQTHNEEKQILTNRFINVDSGIFELRGQVRAAQYLIKQKQYSQATAILGPIKPDLIERLNQFTKAEEYQWSLEKLDKARQQWKDYNQKQALQQSPEIGVREHAITQSKRLASQGQLIEAQEQIEQYIKAYRQDYQTDRQLVVDRKAHRTQQAKTLKLEKEWKSYLIKQRLKAMREQNTQIRQAKEIEQRQTKIQDFKAANQTSKSLQQTLREYLTTVKGEIEDRNQKLAAAKTRKSEASYQKAMVAGKKAIAGKDYDQALNHYQKALSHKPKDKKATKQHQRAASRSPTQQLKKYAPGLSMVKIPSGSFRMGDLSGGQYRHENPVHQVKLKGFRLMKHEVTFEQYDLYAESTGRDKPDDEGWGRGKRPVININWSDANAYAQWLSQKTKFNFRLPSEAEWEYAARSGTTTKFSWGNSASHEKSNYGTDECCSGLSRGSDEWVNTAPVGSFPANQFGLHDLHGNVWEWVQDCWNGSYSGAPQDGSAWMSGNCNQHVVRGGSWFNGPKRGLDVRWHRSDGRLSYLGFRLIQYP